MSQPTLRPDRLFACWMNGHRPFQAWLSIIPDVGKKLVGVARRVTERKFHQRAEVIATAIVAIRKIDRDFQSFPSLRSELHEPRADAMLLREIASSAGPEPG
jgi:hypothetical protein